jgi:hypothetical protein
MSTNPEATFRAQQPADCFGVLAFLLSKVLARNVTFSNNDNLKGVYLMPAWRRKVREPCRVWKVTVVRYVITGEPIQTILSAVTLVTSRRSNPTVCFCETSLCPK